MSKIYDVIIIGSGPAGLTAAIYTTRANLKTLVIAGTRWGGQLMLTTLVENYPGFPDGIQGPDLMSRMRKQAEKHGAEIVDSDFSRLQLPSPARQDVVSGGQSDGGQVKGDFSPLRQGSAGQAPVFRVSTVENTYEGRSVIIATGTDTRWLDVKGEKEKIGRGVSTCAPCDAPFFKDKNIIVVGGGDSAMEEALVLTGYAKTVIIVHRRDTFRASQIMQDKARKNPKIEFVLNTEIVEIMGENKVTGVKLKNNKTGEISEMPVDGVFIAIGHVPNTAAFSAKGGSASGRKGIEVDKQGYIVVKNHTRTSVEGVFVAGDVHDAHYKQAITAAGFGCMAALEAERWLRNQSS